MGIEKKIFGECNAQTIYAFTLTNKSGIVVEILNYGGIIRKLLYKGVDVVFGRDSLEEYLNNEGFFGALIGRNANRIENAEFCLNGKIYKLFNNDGRNNHHGGKVGFDKKIWEAEVVDGDEPVLALSLTSPDGDEGFPGTVNVKVTYTLTNDNSLEIRYIGTSDQDTLLNMTSHSYFNLNGHSSGKIDKHSLWLNSDFYTPNTDEGIPNGEVRFVKNTPFDFVEEKLIGVSLFSQSEQIRKFNGIDHNFALGGQGFRKVGKLTGDKTGIEMEIYTDRKGMHLYTANGIEEDRVCKDGAVYGKHGGICFETQAFPNNINFSHFPSAILKKEEKYDTVTLYKFL